MSNHDLSLVTHSVTQLESYKCKGNGGRDSLLTTASELEDRVGERDREAAVLLQQLAKDGYREGTHCELLFSSLDERLSLVRKGNLLEPVVFPVTFTRGQGFLVEDPVCTEARLPQTSHLCAILHVVCDAWGLGWESQS